jgi:ubiquinone/menaquinone biosynthesis C-methylase UbiE
MQTWNSADAAQRYHQGAARRAQALGPATEQLLDAARVRPGMRVLDLAAGTGETSVLAARRVLPDGSVLAVDISASMLQVATETARAAGLTNLETQVSDLAELNLEKERFDAAISRLGLMFLAEPAGALRRIAGALKPGARLAAIVWSTRAANPYMSTTVEIVEEERGLPTPAPSIVRAFSLASPGVLKSALTDAGFEDVLVEPVALTREFVSVDEAIDMLTSTTTHLPDLLPDASDAERAHVLDEVRRRFARYERTGGACVMPGEVLLGSGIRPADWYDQSR